MANWWEQEQGEAKPSGNWWDDPRFAAVDQSAPAAPVAVDKAAVEEARTERMEWWRDAAAIQYGNTANELLESGGAAIPAVRSAALQTQAEIPKGGELEELAGLTPEAQAALRPQVDQSPLWTAAQWVGLVSPVAAAAAGGRALYGALTEEPGNALGSFGVPGKVAAAGAAAMSLVPGAGWAMSQVPETVARFASGDSEGARQMPLQRVGQVLSTAQRPLAALARGMVENQVAEKARREGRTEVDPVTGRPFRVKSAGEIMDDVLRSAKPMPDTAYDEASYVDVMRGVSRLAGGKGDEWWVWVPGLAGDILLDPTTYLSFGGSSVSKAARQTQGIAFRAMKAAGVADALGESVKIGQTTAQLLGKSGRAEVLPEIGKALREAIPGAAGEQAERQLVELGEAWGREGLKLTLPFGQQGRLVNAADSTSTRMAGALPVTPGRGEIVPGEYVDYLRRGLREWLTESVEQAKKHFDEKALAGGGDPTEGSRKVQRWLDSAQGIIDTFTTPSHVPLLGGQSRSVQETVRQVALTNDGLNQLQRAAQWRISELARAGRSSEELRRVGTQIQMPHDLAYEAFGEGDLWRFNEFATKGLTQADHDSLARQVGNIYQQALAKKSLVEAETFLETAVDAKALIPKYESFVDMAPTRERMLQALREDWLHSETLRKSAEGGIPGIVDRRLPRPAGPSRKSTQGPMGRLAIDAREAYAVALGKRTPEAGVKHLVKVLPEDNPFRQTLVDALPTDFATVRFRDQISARQAERAASGFWRPEEHVSKILDDAYQMDLKRATSNAYAGTIYQAFDAENARHLWERSAAEKILAVLPQADAELLRPHIRGLVSRGAETIGKRWEDYKAGFDRLDDGLRELATHAEDQMREMLRVEQELGIPTEETLAYVTHIIRNHKPIARELGLRPGRQPTKGMQPGAKFTKHRTIGSFAELDELGLDPERNILKVLAARTYAHNVTVQQYRFGDEMIKRLTAIGGAKQITAETLDEARKLSMVPGGVAPGVVEWRGKFYQVDRDIERVFTRAQQAFDLTERHGFLRLATQAMNWWKSRATVARLGFHARNLWSNLWNMWLGGWSGQNAVAAIKAGMVGYARQDMADLVAKVRVGRKQPGVAGRAVEKTRDRILAKMAEWGRKADTQQVVQKGTGNTFTLGQLYDLASQYGVVDKGWLSADTEQTLVDLVTGIQPDSTLKRVWSAMPLGQNFIPTRLLNFGGRGIENHSRMTLFIDRVLTAGDSPEEAARIVKTHLFDYKDISQATRFIKDSGLAPFITWTTKNLPLQMHAIIRQPAKMALPYKVQRTAKRRNMEYYEEQQRIAEEMLPDYIRRAHGIPWSANGIFSDSPEDDGTIFVWSPDAPYRDINTLAADPDGSFWSMMTPIPRYFLESAHPFLKLPVEIATRKRLGMDKEIKTVEAPPFVREFVPTWRRPDAQPGDPDYDTEYMDERSLYALETLLPDIATWYRLTRGVAQAVPGGDQLVTSSPREKQKSYYKALADLTGVGKFVPVDKATQEGAYFRKQLEKLTRALPKEPKD